VCVPVVEASGPTYKDTRVNITTYSMYFLWTTHKPFAQRSH